MTGPGAVTTPVTVVGEHGLAICVRKHVKSAKVNRRI